MGARLEFTEGNSNKFWEWSRTERGTAVVHWGRIGTRGTYQEVPLGEAIDRYYEKIKKGYKPVTDPKRLMEELKPKDIPKPQPRKSKRIVELD